MKKAISAYRVMWLFVFFDLPTSTKQERKNASQFRTGLLKNGFTMMQYSVYIRHCASKEIAMSYKNKIKSLLKAKGKVSILMVTDRQYGKIQNYNGRTKSPENPFVYTQLEIF